MDFLERVKLLFGGKSYDGISKAIDGMKETVDVVMTNQRSMKERQDELEKKIRELQNEYNELSNKVMEAVEEIHRCEFVNNNGLSSCVAWKKLKNRKIRKIQTDMD